MASRENGQSPPIVMLSSFIGGINNDRSDPCKPRMSHLEDLAKKLSICRYLFVDLFNLLCHLI